MNFLPRAEILCPLSVLERVRIIEGFFLEEMYENFVSHDRKLSVLEMCPYGEDRLYRKQAKFMYAELYERLTAPLFLFAVKNVALNEQ